VLLRPAKAIDSLPLGLVFHPDTTMQDGFTEVIVVQ